MWRVNAWYNGSILVEITLIIPYIFFKNDSNGHGGYFLNYYYSNIWIIHVESPTNLPKSMWKLKFNVIDVIFKFGSLEKKTHQIHMNNDPCKAFKKMLLGQKNWKTNKNCNSYGLMKIWSNFNPFKSP